MARRRAWGQFGLSNRGVGSIQAGCDGVIAAGLLFGRLVDARGLVEPLGLLESVPGLPRRAVLIVWPAGAECVGQIGDVFAELTAGDPPASGQPQGLELLRLAA